MCEELVKRLRNRRICIQQSGSLYDFPLLGEAAEGGMSMGIYLPNMEMPKGCAFCRIGKRNGKKMVCPLCDEGWDIHDPMSADHRLDNCPLRPVPPHGRLIDADALSAKLNTMLSMAFGEGNTAFHFAYRSLGKVVENAPTIIEEEGET